jgi:hypothetical protein
LREQRGRRPGGRRATKPPVDTASHRRAWRRRFERLEQVWRAGATHGLTEANSTPKEIARFDREVLAAPDR